MASIGLAFPVSGSSPDQIIWSQYFSRATPRLTGTNALLSISPYCDDTVEDPKAAGLEQAKSAAQKGKAPSLQPVGHTYFTWTMAGTVNYAHTS